MPPNKRSNKYLCTICNIWIADNRAQREQHEAGQKHKTAKVRLLKEIAKKNAAHRSERPEAVAHAAAQQLLEHVAKSVNDTDNGRMDIREKNERGVENTDVGRVREVIGADQVVDENGFPVSAREMYAWREDEQDEGVDERQDDYIPTEALGEFAPDEPEDVTQDNKKGREKQLGYSSGNMDESLENKVQEEQDPEERKLIQNDFKKRSAPKNRRKRRAR